MNRRAKLKTTNTGMAAKVLRDQSDMKKDRDFAGQFPYRNARVRKEINKRSWLSEEGNEDILKVVRKIFRNINKACTAKSGYYDHTIGLIADWTPRHVCYEAAVDVDCLPSRILLKTSPKPGTAESVYEDIMKESSWGTPNVTEEKQQLVGMIRGCYDELVERIKERDDLSINCLWEIPNEDKRLFCAPFGHEVFKIREYQNPETVAFVAMTYAPNWALQVWPIMDNIITISSAKDQWFLPEDIKTRYRRDCLDDELALTTATLRNRYERMENAKKFNDKVMKDMKSLREVMTVTMEVDPDFFVRTIKANMKEPEVIDLTGDCEGPGGEEILIVGHPGSSLVMQTEKQLPNGQMVSGRSTYIHSQ